MKHMWRRTALTLMIAVLTLVLAPREVRAEPAKGTAQDKLQKRVNRLAPPIESFDPSSATTFCLCHYDRASMVGVMTQSTTGALGSNTEVVTLDCTVPIFTVGFAAPDGDWFGTLNCPTGSWTPLHK